MRARRKQAKDELPPKPLTWVLEFRCKDQDHSLENMLELYKGDKNGVLVIDQEGDFKTGKVPCIRVTKIDGLEVAIISSDKAEDIKSTIKITENPGEFDTTDRLKARLLHSKSMIVLLLQALGDCGNGGHSFGINFYSDSPQGKTETFGWDGDGSDFIFTDDLKDELKTLEKE
jgi:hypothetical protein